MMNDTLVLSILLLDKNRNIESANRGSEKIKGYHPNEIIGKNLDIFYSKEDIENGLPQNLIHDATVSGAAVHEGWNVNKDGTKLWAGLTLTAFYNKTGSVTGFSSVTRDLHEKQTVKTGWADKNSNEIERNNLFALINNTKDLMWSVDRNYKLITSNNAFDGMMKYMTGNTIGKGSDVLAIGFTDTQLTRYKELYDRAFAGEVFTVTESTEMPVEFWSELSFHPIRNGDEVVGTACYAHDITERKLAEEKIINTQRLYEFISQINQAITHTKDEDTLFRKACDIAVNIGKFGLAWIAVPDVVNKKINVVAHNSNACSTDIAVLKNLEFDHDWPTANVLRSGEYFAINDFWKQPLNGCAKIYASQMGYSSLIILPIKKSGNTIAIYGMLSTQANLFDEQEIRLLKEASGDISFALDVFEKDKHRKQMAEETAHSKLRLDQAQSIAHLGSWELNFSTGITKWSAENCRIYGVPLEDNIHTYMSWLSFIHPDDLDYVLQVTKEGERTLSSSVFQHRIMLKSGEIKHICSEAHFEFSEQGKPLGLYGIAQDVTKSKHLEMERAK